MVVAEMNESQAKQLLNEIADAFGIGSACRDEGTIKINIANARRRSEYLQMIEKCYTKTVVDDDTGEKYEDDLLPWGAQPDDYLRKFREVASL